MLLERFGILSLFEAKYETFLVFYITMKFIRCLRHLWIFLTNDRACTRFSPWLATKIWKPNQILDRVSSGFSLLVICDGAVCLLSKRLINRFLTQLGKPFHDMKVFILAICWSNNFPRLTYQECNYILETWSICRLLS